MATLQSWRKAYGALKDTTKVGLAKVKSEFKELDIAIVKATTHVERPPKERHIRKIFAATSFIHPRADVAYCIHALARRLSKTRNWVVAIKTLIVIHRTLREGDPTFREELLNYSHRGNILQISNFKDDSSPLAWDCSAWVRTYALFLEERLECFRILKYDIEAERGTQYPPDSPKIFCRTRDLGRDELLEQLPALQQLLFRLVGCQPEGGAYHNYLIQYALALVLKESFKIYCAINDGIINLVDMFFEMSRHDAVKALNIYKRSGQQAEDLSDFYDFCKGLDLARNFQFPTLQQPPPSFLTTMEEYIREAPRAGSISNRKLPLHQEYREINELPKPEEQPAPESLKAVEVKQKASEETTEPPLLNNDVEPEPAQPAADVDFLGLNEINPDAVTLEESNALALAIIPSGRESKQEVGGFSEMGTSGWELALVTTPSNNGRQLIAESKLAGGFDKLLLDSLYEDGEARREQQQKMAYGVSWGANPFTSNDPFAMSNSIVPPPNVQMEMMAQQQQQQYHQQMTTMMQPYQPYQQQFQQYPNCHPQQPQQAMGSTNPFGDPFADGISHTATANPGRQNLL